MANEIKVHKLSLNSLTEALQAGEYLEADEEIISIVVDGRIVILTTATEANE